MADRRRRRAWLLAIGALAGLGGCKLDSTIAITGDPARPIFVVTYDGGKRACISNISVARGTGPQRQYLWGVRRAAGAAPETCVDRGRFGATPPGYEPSFPTRVPTRGERYEVNASGVSWDARTDWVAGG